MRDIQRLPGSLAIVRMDPHSDVPSWVHSGALSAVVRTAEELSLVCDQECVPAGLKCERDWTALKVGGPLAFSQSGVLASLLTPLALHGIPVFVLSTFDTDYILRGKAFDDH